MEAEYKFFPREIAGANQSVRVDVKAADKLKTRPHMIIIMYRYEAQENGYPIHSEFATMNEYEDTLTDNLQGRGLEHLAAITGNGTVDHFFAAPSLDAIDEDIYKHFPLTAKITMRENEAEEFYNSFLLPDVFETNYIHNQQVCYSMQQGGEKYEEARDVDFYTYFELEDNAQQFTTHFDEFAKEINVTKQDDGQYLVHIIASIIPDLPFMNSITDSFVKLSKEYDGTFDGWGSPIMN